MSPTFNPTYNTEFNFFCDIYAQYLPANIKEEMNKKDGAAEQLDYLCKI